MTLSFRSKLLASHVALVLAVGAIVIYTLDRWLTADLVRQLDQRLEEQAKGAMEWAEGGKRHPDRIAARIGRIVEAEATLFERDGTVLGASSPEARADVGPEVEAARSGVVARATRKRGGQELHYVAVPGAEGIVLRLAVPLSEINETVAAMQHRLFFASGLALFVAIALGVFASRVASRPLRGMTVTATRLAQGEFDVPIPTETGDEFGVLWRALKSLAQQLKARISDLVSERDRLSAILEGMVEGVLVLDRDGRVVLANPAVVKILGGEHSIVGRALGEVVTDDETRKLIELARHGEIPETEIEILDHRGATLAVYLRPLAHGDALVAVLRDMTALRRLMNIRRDFVANVSHELRTPVTSIQGYAETLLRGDTDPATRAQFLEIVHRQAVRIGALVEQLLALSELEAKGRDDVVRESVNLLAVSRHVAETVRGRSESVGSKVEIRVPAELSALGDPEGVERALLNLVDNALKYGRHGGTVCVVGKPSDAGRVELSVIDDGPGIEQKHLGRLFERFYRVDPGRARQHGGAGLGLSIVKHLVESMDGSIDVASEPGRGTEFKVTLPAAP